MEQKSLTLLVAGFVTLIIGIALLSSISTQTNEVTDKTYVYQETINPSNCWVRVNMSTAPVGDGPILAQINGSGYTDADCNFSVSNVPTGWKVDDCPLTGVIVYNDSAGKTYTLSTDYDLVASKGVLVMKNTTSTSHWLNLSNDTEVTYAYCSNDYLNSTWGRSILQLVAGIFAIAVLLASVAMFYQLFKNEKVI